MFIVWIRKRICIILNWKKEQKKWLKNNCEKVVNYINYNHLPIRLCDFFHFKMFFRIQTMNICVHLLLIVEKTGKIGRFLIVFETLETVCSYWCDMITFVQVLPVIVSKNDFIVFYLIFSYLHAGTDSTKFYVNS